ncbi:MAG: FtsX-like permease family protein [Nocardiaceae bacterium]|nr:FtsX-like permease family protein [Nocardiaceae bacterium]
MRTAMRIAWRDALKHRATSLIVLVMIAMPVMVVTAFAVFYKTEQISGTEAIERFLGTADALVTTYPGLDPITQRPDPREGWQQAEHPLTIDPRTGQPPGLEEPDVPALIGDRPATPMRQDSAWFRAGQSHGQFEITEVDADNPLSNGLFPLVEGRYPRSTDEIAVSRELADAGARVGRDIEVQAAVSSETRVLHVVGVADRADRNGGLNAVAFPGSFGQDFGAFQHKWLVGGGPVSWSQVEQLNQHGVTVLSRAVLADSPDAPATRAVSWPIDDSFYAVAGTVAAMILIETVLLAGPAMAVGARRQVRTLALVSAAGGTPSQVRAVVLAAGLVVGVVGSLAGVAFGLGLEALFQPVAQKFMSNPFGPWDVPWTWIAIIAALGTASAVAAAMIPARALARQDAAAVIAGRRERLSMPTRLPIAGVVIIAIGVAVTFSRLHHAENDLTIAIGTVLCVIGMALVVPLLVALAGRIAHRLVLPLRFAARDGARHRMRTVPAISAVAATVAGFVAASIGMTTNQEQDRRDYGYVQTVESGVGVVYANGWDNARKVIADHIPGAQFEEIYREDVARQNRFVIQVAVDGATPVPFPNSGGLLIEPSVPTALRLSEAERKRANAALSAGGAVVFAADSLPHVTQGSRLELTFRGPNPVLFGVNDVVTQSEADASIIVIHSNQTFLASAILAPTLADKMGVASAPSALLVRAPAEIDKTVEEDIGMLLGAPGSFSVERGYQASASSQMIRGLLLVAATVLMFAGALTATFLALADARPDLSTLSAVGASPAVRRSISAATALGIAGAGAILGFVVGLAPGIAVTYPLTELSPYLPSGMSPRHVLAIPWGQLALVVLALPLVTAAIAAVCTRSKVPVLNRTE